MRRIAYIAMLACLLVMAGLAEGGAEPNNDGLALTSLEIKAGHSRLVKLPSPVIRVSVGEPKVADVVVITDRQIYLNARAAGTTNVSLWGKGDRLMGVFEVRVARDLTRLKQRLFEVLPQEPVEVREMQGAVVLSGLVSSLEAKKRAETLAEAFAPKQVTSLLQVGDNQQVLLKVAFAEVSRRVTKRFNINVSAFNPFTGDFLFTLLGNVIRPTEMIFGVDEKQNSPTTFGDNATRHTLGFELEFARTMTGMGGFKVGDTRVLSFLDILKQNGLAKILAEPTLVATSGQEADFLAGGEFPIPVPQRDSVTIQFKQYGVQLKFKPEVLANGHINLTVMPEVSELDFTVAVVVQGYSVPGLTTRRAKTQLELKDGQSFAIAGLFRDDVTQAVSKFPVLGDLPILGALFRSSDFVKKKTELVIVVTPQVVRKGMGEPGRLPTDGYVEPDDFSLFLLGAMTKREPHAEGAPPLSPNELEGRFGQDWVF